MGKRKGRYGEEVGVGGWARRDTRGERGYDGRGAEMVEGKWGDDQAWRVALVAAACPPPNLPTGRGEG